MADSLASTEQASEERAADVADSEAVPEEAAEAPAPEISYDEQFYPARPRARNGGVAERTPHRLSECSVGQPSDGGTSTPSMT